MFLGGRLTPMNAVLSTMPSYLMSVTILPKSVRQKTEGIRIRFLWFGKAHKRTKYHLVAWGHVCKPKAQGGLDVVYL